MSNDRNYFVFRLVCRMRYNLLIYKKTRDRERKKKATIINETWMMMMIRTVLIVDDARFEHECVDF